jgi:hypothetical protein
MRAIDAKALQSLQIIRFNRLKNTLRKMLVAFFKRLRPGQLSKVSIQAEFGQAL